MKLLSHGQAANKPGVQFQSRHKGGRCTFGAAAGVLLSVPLMAGPMNQASAQDAQDSLVQYVSTPLGKAFRVKGDTTLYYLSRGYVFKTDTTYKYVDSSSDTITQFTRITYGAQMESDWQKSLIEKLTAWGAPLDAKGREGLLSDNLKLGTLPDAVFQAAKNLHLSDQAIQRLQALDAKLHKKWFAPASSCPSSPINDAERLTMQGLPLDAQAKEEMLRKNLNLGVGASDGAVLQAAKNLGLSESAIQRLQDTLKKRCDADGIVTDVADVHGLRDPEKQEELLREELAIGKEPGAVFLAAEKLNLPDPAIQRLRLYLRGIYADADKRQH